MADTAYPQFVYVEREVVWLTIIGSASIQIRADDKFFESDVRKAVNKIKNLTIKLSVDADISKASKKIRDLRYRITSKDAVLKVDADVSKAEEKLTALLAKFTDNEISVNVNADTAAAEAALQALEAQAASTNASINATSNTAVANAALNHAARPRVAPIHAVLSPASRAALMAAMNILSGTLPVEKIRGALLGLVTNFEGIAAKGAIVVATLGAIGAAALTAGANLFAIVGDAAQAGQALAFLPAGLFALQTILRANKFAWQDFGTAAKDNSAKANEALAKLPPEAQAAAKALRGVKDAIQKPTQAAFWEAAGTSLQDMVAVQLPSVIAGMSRIGSSMGAFSKIVFDTVRDLGDFNDVFVNIAGSVDGLATGMKPAIEGLATFIGVGSRFLPQFGQWLGDLGTKFGEFAAKAEESGAIVSWINTGTKRLQELGSVASSTIGIFNGLANASRMSGSEGLTGLAEGMKRWSDVINGEPFQSRLITILEGARSGTAKLGEGFRTLTALIGRSSDTISIFLDKAGEVGGLAFESITSLFNGTNLGSGLMSAIEGLGEALQILQPGFADLGDTIGGLGEIAGELLVNTASGLNMLFSTLNGVVAGLKDGIIATMPVLNAFVQGLMSVAAVPLIALAEGIGNVLEFFAGLPTVVQYAVAAIGLFLLLGPRITAMFMSIRAASAATWARMSTDAVAGGGAVQNAFGRNVAAIGTAWRNVGTELASNRAMAGFMSNTDRMTAAAGSVSRAIGTTANQGLRAAGNGLMGAMGGPWGLAIGGAIAVLGMFSAAQADAAAKVQSLASTLDQQTGAFTEASEKLLLTEVLDLNATGWDDLARSGRRNMEELAAATGLNMGVVKDKLSDPAGRDEFIQNWKNVRDAMGDGSDVSDQLAASVGMTREQLAGLSQTDLDNMVSQFEKGANMAAQAEAKVKAVADAMGTNTVVAAQLSKNYDTLKSATSGADAKFQALKQNIDLLSGSQRTAHGAAREYAQSLDDQKAAIHNLVQEHGGVIESTGRMNDAFRNTLLNADGSFSVASQGARDFSTQMDVAADAILKSGTAALDGALKAGKSMPEAMAAAMHTMEPAIATLRGSLETLGFDAGQVDAIIKQLGLDPTKLTAAMSVDTDQAMMDVARLKLSMTSYADGNYEAVLAALPQQAKDALTDTMGLGEAFKNGDYEAILSALDKTAGGREAALASLITFEGKDWKTHLLANNLVPEEVARANAAADAMMPEKTTTLRTNDLTTSILEKVNAYMVHDKKTLLTADDKVTDVLGQVNNSTLADKSNTLTTQDLVTGMVNTVNATQLNNKLNTLETQDLVSDVLAEVNAKTLDGKHNTLTTSDLATIIVQKANGVAFPNKANRLDTTDGATSVVQRAIGVLFPNKSNRLDTADHASGVVRAANSVPLYGKSAAISADARSFYGTLNGIRFAPVPRIVVPVFAQYAGSSGAMQTLVRAGGMADGGLIQSGVQTFANGGILNRAVKAFASGGTENHVAQIAKGAWPVRIWAEPETHGEAYIPLAKGKRKRSLEILRQVMDEFGLSNFAQFADGGFNRQSYATPSVVSSRYTAQSSPVTSTAGPVAAGSVVNFTVNPSQGLSEQQIGEAAMRELYWQLTSR